jgi:hypothetical protein
MLIRSRTLLLPSIPAAFKKRADERSQASVVKQFLVFSVDFLRSNIQNYGDSEKRERETFLSLPKERNNLNMTRRRLIESNFSHHNPQSSMDEEEPLSLSFAFTNPPLR